MLAVQEGEETRLALLDDVDLDAVDHRQPPAAQLRRDRLLDRVAFRRLLVVQVLAVVRVALQHHARRAPPVDQAKGVAADRVGHDPVAVGLDHLARHRAGQRAARQVVQEARVRLEEADLVRVAVDHAQALDLAVVVEAAGLLRLGAQRLHARYLPVHEVELLRLVLRIPVPLQRIHVVGGGQLALLAVERRVVGEVDPGPDADGPDTVVGRDLGHAVGAVRHDLRRPGEEVVAQRRVEDMGQDDSRVQVVDLRRIEAGLGYREGEAQHLVLRGGGRRGGDQQDERGEQADDHRGRRDRADRGTAAIIDPAPARRRRRRGTSTSRAGRGAAGSRPARAAPARWRPGAAGP